jgi:hypothetical protein
MEAYTRQNIIVILSEKYYDKIMALGGFNDGHHKALELFGVYEVVVRIADVLLKKAAADPNYSIKKMLEESTYIMSIARNILNNLSRRKELIQGPKIIQNADALIDAIAIDELITITKGDDLYKEPDIITAILQTMEKLYDTLHAGNLNACDHLARYYKKLLERLRDQRIKDACEASLHQFYAELYCDAGKLKIAQKHAQSSIYLYNESKQVFGHTFIASAYNVLVMTHMNSKEYKTADEAFAFNVQAIQKSTETRRDTKELLLNKIKMEYGMFCSTVPNKAMADIFREAIEFDTVTNYIDKSYAMIYNLLDRNKHEESKALIDGVMQHAEFINNDHTMNSIRADVAIAESLTQGFTSREQANEILAYCTLAEQANISIQSKYFKCIIEIIRGFALNDDYTVSLYCKKLAEYGYIHFSSWYRRRAIKNI